MPRNPNKTDYSGNFPPFFHAFNLLDDPRNGGNTKHHFGEVLFMVFTCVLCGISNYEHMEEFCDANEEWFLKWISLPNGTPSYNTFSRIFEALDPTTFSQCIVNHLEAIGKNVSAKHIAIDGKALRGSKNTEDRHIHSVSAWACDEGLTLAQTFVSKKSNEITAIPELLKLLNIEGAVVSIDAMGAQTSIAEMIVDMKGDYLLSVKGNQKSLFDEINDQFVFALRQLDKKKLNPANWSSDETVELVRGREETRRTLISHNLEWMAKPIKNKWKKLSCVIMVYRHTILEDGSIRHDVSFYMSSLDDVKAPEIQQFIRNHWNIENSCHWVLDTVFREDANQVSKRNAAKNLATARRIALNTIKLAPEISKRKKPASMVKKQLRAAHDHSYREQCLSLV